MKTTENQLAEKYPISVIIPCFNAAETLKDCLATLLKNDLTNVELIVVDDASTDNTGDLIKGFDSSIRYIVLSERGGPAAARNTGIRASRHPYLFFLDADIILPDQTLAWVRETLDLYSHQERVVGVLGTYAERIPAKDFFTIFKNLYTCYLYRITDTFSPFIHTPMFAVRKSVLDQEGGFDEDMRKAEDFKLGAILGSKGYQFIIDWRIKGIHLKRYTFLNILREDWARIRELRRIQLTSEQSKFSYRAHRWSRILSLVLPGITVLLAALGFFWGPSVWMTGTTIILFLLVNGRLFLYIQKHQGIGFAIASVIFLFVEMLWAQIALVLSVFPMPERFQV